MRLIRTKAAVAGLGVALSLAACGDAGDDSSAGVDVEVADNAAEEFDDGTRMKELADSGDVIIGVKFDQPGIGFKGATDDMPVGSTPSSARCSRPRSASRPRTSRGPRRSPTTGSRSCSRARSTWCWRRTRSPTSVGRSSARPAPTTSPASSCWSRSDSDIDSLEDVKGTEVCSVTGSTSLENIEAEGATPRGFDTYSECVDQVLSGAVDAMTTDGAILLGYAAEHPDELKVVVEPFSEERYGVGYSLDHPEMCQWIVDTLTAAQDDGTWEDAFAATLGASGVETPEPPAMDECPAA